MTAPETAAFAVRVSPQLVQRNRRWNRGIVIAASALGVGIFALLVWFAVLGRATVVTWVLLALTIGMVSAVLFTTRNRMRMLGLLAGGDGVLRIDDAGIHAPGLPPIAWTEIIFTWAVDDRQRAERTKRVPVFGWGTRAVLRAGGGTILGTIGVRDGEGLRQRTTDRGAARTITLYARQSDGLRRAAVSLLLDAVFDELDTEAVVAVLGRYAEATGLPFATFVRPADAIVWQMPLLDEELARPGDERGLTNR